MEEDADLPRVTLPGPPLHPPAAFVPAADGLPRELALVRIGSG